MKKKLKPFNRGARKEVIKSEVLLGYNLSLTEYKNPLVAEFNPPLDNPTLFTISY